MNILDGILPEQAPEKPSTSLLMIAIVMSLLLGEVCYMVYKWFDRKFGDDKADEQTEQQATS